MGWKFKDPGTAAFKAWVCHTNGYKATYYSRDWRGTRYDPKRGFRSLLTALYKKAQRGQIRCAIIYDKRSGRDEVVRKTTGNGLTWSIHKHLKF